jgi:short-subunit dehydrogenase
MEESRLVAGRRLMDARTVARAGYAGMQQGKTVVIPGLSNRLLVEAVRVTPRNLTTRIVRLAQERVHRHADGSQQQ